MYIEFYEAKWCTACHGIKPHVISACKELGIDIEYIDADQSADYCVARNVGSLPTIIAYNDSGNELDRIIGTVGKYDFIKRITDSMKE